MFFSEEEDLADEMLAFIETYNQTAEPFKWTYTGKSRSSRRDPRTSQDGPLGGKYVIGHMTTAGAFSYFPVEENTSVEDLTPGPNQIFWTPTLTTLPAGGEYLAA